MSAEYGEDQVVSGAVGVAAAARSIDDGPGAPANRTREGIMSETFCCDDKDTLVAYLYGEIDPVVRHDLESHLRRCAACSDEVASLQSVRRDLESWVPPMPDLGFTIVRQPQAAAPVLTSPRWNAVR